MSNSITIRKAQRSDVSLVFQFVCELAQYEKMESEVVTNEAMLEEELFDKGSAEVIFAMVDGKEVGFALFFHNFSTFKGKRGLYLEDLFVRPEYRGRGCGKSLLSELIRIAKERKYGRVEWMCLDWNTPSIEFYRSMGAVQMDDRRLFRLTEETMQGK